MELENFTETIRGSKGSIEQVPKSIHLYAQSVGLNVEKQSDHGVLPWYQDEDVAFLMFDFNM